MFSISRRSRRWPLVAVVPASLACVDVGGPADDRVRVELQGLIVSEAASLAAAQRAALRAGRTAHPFYWAGFALSGTRAED